MKSLRFFCEFCCCVGVFASASLFVPQSVFCQMEKLGIVQYTSPKGMTKTLKENVVAFGELNTTGTYWKSGKNSSRKSRQRFKDGSRRGPAKLRATF